MHQLSWKSEEVPVLTAQRNGKSSGPPGWNDGARAPESDRMSAISQAFWRLNTWLSTFGAERNRLGGRWRPSRARVA